MAVSRSILPKLKKSLLGLEHMKGVSIGQLSDSIVKEHIASDMILVEVSLTLNPYEPGISSATIIAPKKFIVAPILHNHGYATISLQFVIKTVGMFIFSCIRLWLMASNILCLRE
jgi:hypothetical protein